MTPAPAPAPTSGWPGLQFSLGGIPVLIRPAFLLVAVIFGASVKSPALTAIWVGIVFLSVLVHELGHALAMRLFGFAPSIELHAMGGLTSWSRERVPTPGQRMLVTLSGPGAGLLLGGLATLAKLGLGDVTDPNARFALDNLQFANLAWSLINLIPVLPWDGGLILDAGVELVGKKPRPKIAAISSILIGGAVVLFALRGPQLMLIYFGAMGIWQGYLRLKPAAPEDDLLGQVWSLIQTQRFAEAERLATEKAEVTPEAAERAQLYEAIAWTRVFRDDWAGAERAIGKMGAIKPSAHLAAMVASHEGRHEDVIALLTPLPQTVPELLLRTESLVALKKHEQVVTDALDLLARQDPKQKRQAQRLSAALFEAGAFEPSLQVSLSAFEILREPVHLVNAACAYARLGQISEGLAAVNRAIDAGYAEKKHLEGDPDLAVLRAAPGWDATIARATG